MCDHWFGSPGEDEAYRAALQFVPESLTLARELRGLTKSELATRVHKSAGAISQFENAITRPDPRTLKQISLALGFPLSFFSREISSTPISMDYCHFRSLRSTSQKDRRKILANGTLLRNLIEVLDDFVDFPEEQVSRIARQIYSDDDIERFAVKVREAWGLGIGPIPELFQLLESKGILLSFIADQSEDVDAFSFWQPRRPFIFLVSSKGSPSRTRFDCAHELGHLLMHADAVPGNKELEAQANRFAGAFLVPREAFIRECPRRLNWEHFYELKRRWRVSLAALIRRAYDLDCISEATYRRAYVQLNQMGQRYNEPYEPPVEAPTMIQQALVFALEDVSMQDIADRLKVRLEDLEDVIAASNGTTPVLQAVEDEQLELFTDADMSREDRLAALRYYNGH